MFGVNCRSNAYSKFCLYLNVIIDWDKYLDLFTSVGLSKNNI